MTRYSTVSFLSDYGTGDEFVGVVKSVIRSIEPAVKVPKSTAVTAKKPAAAKTKTSDESPSALIDARIEELGDWRGEMLSRLRAVIKAADPEVTEE